MKVDIIIILGPTTGFNPIASDEHPKFELPFLNIPLLTHSLNSIRPIAGRVFMMCADFHEKQVLALLRNTNLIIELILMNGYEGFYSCIQKVKNSLSSNVFFMCKGDTFFVEPLDQLLNTFERSNDDMHLFVRKAAKGPPITIDSKGYLKSFESNKIPFIINDRLKVTLEYSTQGFYMCRKAILDDIDSNCYKFKAECIPKFIENGKAIRMIETCNLQVKTIEDYMKQIEFRANWALSYVIINPFSQIDKITKDSVCDSSCIFGENTRITKSVILKNSKIGNKCIIEGCVLGAFVYVCDGCKLFNCKVAPGYIFNKPITAKCTDFS